MKTVRRVCVIDGEPVITILPNGQFDVLCFGNEDEKCRGCVYKRRGIVCGAPCIDKDHIQWVFSPYIGENRFKGTRIKRASLYDEIVTEDGKRFVIVESRGKPSNFEVVEKIERSETK